MSNFVDKMSDVQKFLSVLTWKKLIQLIAFIFIIGLTWATYENRDVIYGFVSQKRIDPVTPHVRSLSKKTSDEINAVSERSELIIGMQVVLADFQKNQRVVIYTYIDENRVMLKQLYSRYQNTSIDNVPLFSDSVEDNKHLVALINGEFSCRPFAETLSAKIAPEAGQYIKYTCSNGIPASYGRFTGLIVVYLQRQPTPEEYDQIRSISRTLATTIFERDLNK